MKFSATKTKSNPSQSSSSSDSSSSSSESEEEVKKKPEDEKKSLESGTSLRKSARAVAVTRVSRKVESGEGKGRVGAPPRRTAALRASPVKPPAQKKSQVKPAKKTRPVRKSPRAKRVSTILYFVTVVQPQVFRLRRLFISFILYNTAA